MLILGNTLITGLNVTLLVKADYEIEQKISEPNGEVQTLEEGISTDEPPTPLFSEDIWNLNATNEWWAEFAKVDSDSAEMVIGVNNAKQDGYEKLLRLIEENGGELINTVSVKGEVWAVVADVPLDIVSSLAIEVSAAGLSRYVEPNMRFQVNLVPNDPYWPLQWGPARIEADYAWNTTIGDPSVLVAIIDTGVDWTHPDLAENYVPLGYDWVNDDPYPLDDHGHGTHCAGIVAAVLNNGIGIAGLAQVQIMAEKALDQYGYGWTDDLANAIVHSVDAGADILSNSWGSYVDSELIHEAVKYAYENGVLVVAAAGNEETDRKLYPAAYDEVIAVTATDQYDYPAWFTNFGEWVELAAPGVDIYSTVPWGYEAWSGTSMSTPHVAGVAALIWSQSPNMTRDQVRLQLRYTAEDLGSPGFDYYYGYGRVNARRAVEQPLPEHDLAILAWEKPPFVELESSAIINTTVCNFGTFNETDITVQLLVNGSVADSATIDFLETGESETVNCTWTPTVEGTYNLTSYVLPVPGENLTENNKVTAMVRVGRFKYVLFDQTHHTDSMTYYNVWITALTEKGYVIDAHTYGPITSAVLEGYLALVIPQAREPYSPDELSAIENFVVSGGGLLVIGDNAPSIYTDLTSFAGITWSPDGLGGYTSDITPHPVTEGVATAYFGSPMSSLYVSHPAQDLIRDSGSYVMLAASEIGCGKVLAIADEHSINDYCIGYADNFKLANNMIHWLAVLPEHDLSVTLETPLYIEPGGHTLVNVTVHNRGLSNETDVKLYLFINETTVKNITIPELLSGSAYTMDYLWTPTVEDELYNVTGYVAPVENETRTRNNIAWTYIYVGYPVKAFVLDSAGTDISGIISTWQALTNTWYLFGDRMTLIDYSTLNKEDITYEDLAATQADVLIISCACDPWSGWEFTDSEIEAITRYVHEGHGLIATSGTFYTWVPNNNKLAPLFGLNHTVTWEFSYTDLLHIQDLTHPLFRNVPNPYTFPRSGTAIPADRRWDSNELAGGEYVALGHFQESAVVVFRGLVYISPLLELGIAPYYHFHLQLLYNAITWSRYQKPEHELLVSLEAPRRLKPGESSLLNATVCNMGINNETDVQLFLLINGTVVNSTAIPSLLAGECYTIRHLWTPTVEGIYNVTAYAPPVPDEEFTLNNHETEKVFVREFVIEKVLVYTDDAYESPSSRYPIVALNNLEINYTHYPDDPTGFLRALTTQFWDLVIVSHNNWYEFGNNWQELEEYVLDGGLLVLSTFDIDGSHSEPTTLWSTLGVQWTYDMAYPEPVYRWMPNHPIFTIPNTLGDLTSYVEGYIDDGDHVAATTGTPVAGFTTSPTTGHAAIVVGNDGRTVLMSFLLCEFRYDEDGDGKLDAVELWENAIAFVAIPVEHELAVTLEAPAYLKPGNSSLLNVTVCNRGLSNETDVQLFLFINDTVVNSTTIPNLPAGECYTIRHLWTPTVEGIYNVTAYAPPVPDEEFTLNNVKSLNIPVTRVIVALFKNVDSWDYPSNEEALSLYGIPYIVFDSSYFGTIDLSQFSKVVIASDQDQTFYYDVEAYRWWFEDYVRSGGVLEIHAADGGWHGGYWVGPLPGGLGWVHYGSNYVTIVDPTHPVVTTPNMITDRELDEWGWSVHGYFTAYPLDSKIVIIEDSTSYPAYLEFEYGDGFIIASSQTLEWAYKHRYSLILENSLLYMPVRYEHDVAIVDVAPSADTVLVGDMVNVTVVAENQGTSTESFNVTVYGSDCAASLLGIPNEPHQANAMWIEPSWVNLTGVSVGHRFNVTLWVNMTTGFEAIIAWQFFMIYDKAYLNATRAGYTAGDKSQFFENITTLPVLPSFSYYNATHNYVMHGECWFMGPMRGAGYGSLSWVEFEVVAAPPFTCTLDISTEYHPPTGWTYVLDQDGNEIPLTPYNSVVGGAPPTPPPPTPPPTPPSAYTIGKVTVTDLAPGENITLIFTWNTTGVPLGNYTIWAEASIVPGETDTADNNYINGFIRIVKGPVASFTYSPPRPKAGEKVTFNASTSTPNGGAIINYRWDFGDGNITLTTDPLITHVYAPGGSFNVTLTILDSEGLTDTTWKTIYVFKRDIAVLTVTPSTNRTYVGRTLTINITVLNEGEVNETFQVVLYYNITAGKIIGTTTITDILPGENRTLTMMWDTTGVDPCRHYTITAVAVPVKGETETADNTLTSPTLVHVKILGDVNGDGVVDIKDILASAIAFGSYPSSPLWNPDCDLDQNLIIDIKDIFTIATNYGKTCS